MGIRVELPVGSTNNAYAVAWTPSTATWYHLAITRDQSAGDIIWYLDGVRYGSNLSTTTSAINDVATPFTTGAGNNSGSAANPLNGAMDEWAVYSKVLSVAEVRALYGYGTPPVYEAAVAASTSIKSVNGLAQASIKSWNGVVLD